jgi:hypothetical protein
MKIEIKKLDEMKRVLVVLLITMLLLGASMRIVVASSAPQLIQSARKEDEHEFKEERTDTNNVESDNEDEDLELDDKSSKEDSKKVSNDSEDNTEENDESLSENGEESYEKDKEKAIRAIMKAEEKIDEIFVIIKKQQYKDIDLENMENILDIARGLLLQAKMAYNNSYYELAKELAHEAEELAENLEDILNEFLEKLEGIEHVSEEEDEEEDNEIEVSEEDDELRIKSKDSDLRLDKESPKIKFKYYVNNDTEVEVKARFRALIEFIDLNEDGKIQDEEVLQELDLGDIAWAFTYQETTEENNKLLEAVYYANLTTYEIMIVARTYQRAVVETDAAENTVLVFDIDGGADEAKFDIIILRWMWVSNQSQLALLMKAEAGLEVEGAITEESAGVDEKQITLQADGVKIKITWVTKAKIIRPDSSEAFENVTVTYKSVEVEREWEEHEEEVEVELKVYFVYPNFGKGKLIHDPSIGVEDDPLLSTFTLINRELLLGLGIMVMIMTMAMISLGRRYRLEA